MSQNGLPTLRKKDVQLFLKRLRKKHGAVYFIDKRGVLQNRSIKYYCVGEYGTRYKRPHYHFILFSANIELIEDAWRCPDTGFPLGSFKLGDVNERSIGYTLKYLCKPRTKFAPGDDRSREFTLISKGVGLGYITPAIIQYHKRDLVNHSYLQDGNLKIAMPRYYRNRLYTAAELDAITKAKSVKLAELMYRDFLYMDATEFLASKKNVSDLIDADYRKRVTKQKFSSTF